MKRILRVSVGSLALLLPGAAALRCDEPPTYTKYPLTKIPALPENVERPRRPESPERRVKAYHELLKMREALGVKHVRTRYCSSPQDTPEGCLPRGKDEPVPGGPTAPGGNVNGCAWTSVGPTNINGKVTSIAIDPANNQRIFVTTVGGIWRSADAGRRWERVSDDFLATVFSSIAVNGREIVAGGGNPNYDVPGDGIWRSTANGDPGSWSKVGGTTFDDQIVYRLSVDPSNGDIYAAASNGVWLGTHGAGNLTFGRLGGFDAGTNDIAVDYSSSPRVVYAGVMTASASFGKGIWKRTSPGTWQQRDTGIATGDISKVALGLAASSPNTLYSKIARATDGRLLGVFKTTTGGEPPLGGGNAWALLAGAAVTDDSSYAWYNSVIEVDPTDANRVYAGGIRVYRSIDGSTFSPINAGTDPGWTYGPHADVHAVAFDPGNPRIVWIGDDGGIDRTTDTSLATWRWLDMAHGMVMTQFYRLTSQQAMASLRAGGSQDNGTEITFGNRTWYQPGGCDGSTVAIDGADPDTLFGNCNGGLAEFVNPVPGWAGGPTTLPWTSPVSPIDPLVSDPAMAGAALAQGQAPVDMAGIRTGPPILLKTTNGRSWTQANASRPLAIGQDITAIGIAPSSTFQTYYVGVTGGGATAIWLTSNGGTLWSTASTGLPNARPNRIAVDNTNPLRAFVAFSEGSNGVWMTTNGLDWHSINGVGATAYPPDAGAGALVIDPNDAHTLYVATTIGVFRGTVAGSPTDAAWMPMDEGLPDGLNVTDIWVGRGSGTLTISSNGHGAFQRDIRPDVACRTQMLLVRDNVYDRGVGVSPSGMPDPEHPIPDPVRPGFFRPDDTEAGKVYWYSSTDIRIDVPSLDPPANTIANADHVEVETCPIEMSSCPSGTVWDNHPVRGQLAKAYVQVSNQGIDPVHNVRVIALYLAATSVLQLLPPDFWTTTFPAGSTGCGPLSSGSGWQLVDPAQPCRLITVVNPAVPETIRFDWNVPSSQEDHTCMLTIVESVDDPLDPSVRATNERRLGILVRNNRQIASRNLHVVNAPALAGSWGVSGMGLGWPKEVKGPVTLLISQAGMPKQGQLGLLLPPGVQPNVPGISAKPVKLNKLQLAEAKELGVVPTVAWMVSPGRKEVQLTGVVSEPGQGVNVGFYWTLAGAPRGSTWRFATLARAGSEILGGSVYYLRVAP